MSQDEHQSLDHTSDSGTAPETDQPTWPHVDRRSGKERRCGDDRRQDLRYGRRKGKVADRRISPVDRRTSE